MVEQVIDFLEGAVLQFRDIEIAPDCSKQRGTAKHEADFASEIRLVGVDLVEGEKSAEHSRPDFLEGEVRYLWTYHVWHYNVHQSAKDGLTSGSETNGFGPEGWS